MKKCIGTILLGCVFAITGLAQKLTNIVASLQGNQIMVQYDLVGANPKDRYEVELYASHNNFATPLRQVQGDVGQNVYPGTSKKMIWQAQQELRTFDGQLSFEVRGKLIVGALVMNEASAARRGKVSSIGWTGGMKGESLKLDLMDKDGNLVQHIASAPNEGSFSWAVPADTKKGSYRVQLTQGNEKIMGNPFEVKGKLPILLFVAVPVVIVGAYLATKTESNPPSTDLPKPPGLN